MAELLTWAYVRQKVQLVRDEEERDARGPRMPSWSPTGLICADLAAGAVIRGSRKCGPVKVHPDALAIDDFVRRLSPGERHLVRRHAEMQREPEWSPRTPLLVCVPVLRGQWTLDTFLDGNGHAKSGAVKTLAGKRDKPVACLIDYEGFPRERAEAMLWHARGVYETWHSALRVLWTAMQIEDNLTRWRITGVGAEREPWALLSTA